MTRLSHPDNPAHVVAVADESVVERYTEQGWRPVDDDATTPDADGSDADDD